MIVCGAGIAGLAHACAVALQGRRVVALERAPELREVGAGLQVAPNGGRVLDALGVHPPSLESEAVHLIDGPSARPVLRMPLGPGFRLVHRADLIAALRDAAVAAGVDLRLGQAVVGIDPAGAVTTEAGMLHAPRIVGADGVRGLARRTVAPDHPSRFTGQVAWRAVVPCPDDWPREAQVRMGPGRHLVIYPLPGGRLNLVGVEERAQWAEEGWSHRDDPGAFLRAFRGFGYVVRRLLERVEEVHLWGLMDHGVTPAWRDGAVTLIGDAAHPTLPFLAQGANLALEDAWTLARSDDPAAWEAMRRPRVERALAAAAANARNYHLGGAARLGAHAALRAVGAVAPSAMGRRYRWLYDYDPISER
ncbi:FAD-dependent monooxygenase [Jannaschia sp. Os4]|uniref:FAD-dependent monooxygenase n=1 Tax=Jannaschia sp. Os4 TaxID=2807617 RepID=UPI00193A8B1D|nr:FAD-dependent monooxygenase [Jannaschia sp. Os4]